MLAAGCGCFAFALLLAEPFLYLTSYETPSQSFVLTIDVSGSMAGSTMEEVKLAAKQFVETRLNPAGGNLSDVGL
ncbi:MAG: hypothetical protein LBJ67_06075 [Planctomycetaceae bacterium]|jgi:uncharacterized protein with von Willebrand factor type A (vWA) domain|nr:hypothetical protein [Planctomycetaceae bacterium]